MLLLVLSKERIRLDTGDSNLLNIADNGCDVFVWNYYWLFKQINFSKSLLVFIRVFGFILSDDYTSSN